MRGAGSGPATLEVFVGLNVGGDDPDDPRLELDPAAVADGLAEWGELGVGHVQLAVFPTTSQASRRPSRGFAASARPDLRLRPVKPFRFVVNSHVCWAMPEQSFAPVVPGQPPLSRWIAHIDSALIPFDLANGSKL
jgi:hypothetical protein